MDENGQDWLRFSPEEIAGLSELRDTQEGIIGPFTPQVVNIFDLAAMVEDLSSRFEELSHKMDNLRSVTLNALYTIQNVAKDESLVVANEGPLYDFIGQFIAEVEEWT